MPKGNVQVLNIDMILLTRYVGWKLLEASVVQTESELAWKLEIFKCVRGPHPHLEKNDNSNEAVVRDVRYCIGPSIQNLVTLRISHFIQEYFVTSNT